VETIYVGTYISNSFGSFVMCFKLKSTGCLSLNQCTYVCVYMYCDKAHFSPPLNCLINELTIHAHASLTIVHWSAFPGAYFLGLSDTLKWLSNDSGVTGQVSIHPAGNCHSTGKRAWSSNWLLFVIIRAQTGLK